MFLLLHTLSNSSVLPKRFTQKGEGSGPQARHEGGQLRAACQQHPRPLEAEESILLFSEGNRGHPPPSPSPMTHSNLELCVELADLYGLNHPSSLSSALPSGLT